LIKSVTFHLHPSFPNPVRTVTSPRLLPKSGCTAFSCTSQGWGEFIALVKLTYTDPSHPATVLKHNIKLYPGSNTGPVGLSSSPPSDPWPSHTVHEFYDEVVFTDVSPEVYESVMCSGPAGGGASSSSSSSSSLPPASPPCIDGVNPGAPDPLDLPWPAVSDAGAVGRLARALRFIEGEVGIAKDRILRANSEMEQAVRLQKS